MKTINLKDYYPYYTKDTFLEVSDEVAALFEIFAKAEGVKSPSKIGRDRAHW